MILAIRTDNPQAEVYIMNADGSVLADKKWHAHKLLLETIHVTIRDCLVSAGSTFDEISGVIFYEGPGSFTGLRIGCSVANAIAISNNVPIVAVTSDDWLTQGTQLLLTGKGSEIVEPKYGSDPHITTPR